MGYKEVENKMISVEIGLLADGKISEEVEIYLDDDGLDFLLNRLSRLKEKKTDQRKQLKT